jgi:hypothetical protein
MWLLHVLSALCVWTRPATHRAVHERSHAAGNAGSGHRPSVAILSKPHIPQIKRQDFCGSCTCSVGQPTYEGNMLVHELCPGMDITYHVLLVLPAVAAGLCAPAGPPWPPRQTKLRWVGNGDPFPVMLSSGCSICRSLLRCCLVQLNGAAAGPRFSDTAC